MTYGSFRVIILLLEFPMEGTMSSQATFVIDKSSGTSFKQMYRLAHNIERLHPGAKASYSTVLDEGRAYWQCAVDFGGCVDRVTSSDLLYWAKQAANLSDQASFENLKLTHMPA